MLSLKYSSYLTRSQTVLSQRTPLSMLSAAIAATTREGRAAVLLILGRGDRLGRRLIPRVREASDCVPLPFKMECSSLASKMACFARLGTLLQVFLRAFSFCCH